MPAALLKGLDVDANPKFVLDEPLPPLLITRQLLSEIERQMVATENDVIRNDAQASGRSMQVAVDDAYGTEIFPSAANVFPTSQFPETTSAVRLTLLRYLGPEPPNDVLSINIKFIFRSGKGNRVSIRVHGPRARERAMGLFDRVQQLIEPQRLDSLVFRREPAMSAAGLLAVVGGLFWLLATISNFGKDQGTFATRGYWYWTAAILTAAAYVLVSRTFFPHCAFETRRWAKLEAWRDWAIKGFLTAVVFDIGLVVTLNQIATRLGFTLR